MKNNIQRNVMVNVDELTRLATYGGNDGGPQPRGIVISAVTVAATKIISATTGGAVTGYISKKASKFFGC